MNYKKKQVPFYLRTKYQNESMLPIKNFISVYLNKPQIRIPKASELNGIFENAYKYSKPLSMRRMKHKELMSDSQKKENEWRIRQKKYQAMFCSTTWNSENWKSLKGSFPIVKSLAVRITPKSTYIRILNKSNEKWRVKKRASKSFFKSDTTQNKHNTHYKRKNSFNETMDNFMRSFQGY